MTKQSIRTLEIGNFKSIDSLQIQGLSPFSVFAGANGSGKSNFIDALDFVSTFVRHGIDAALQRYGGIKNIRSRKRAASKADRFDFQISCEFVDEQGLVSVFDYSLRIHRLYEQPELEEFLNVNGDRMITRKIGNGPSHQGNWNQDTFSCASRFGRHATRPLYAGGGARNSGKTGLDIG